MGDRMIDPLAGGRGLLAAVILAAVKDARAGRPCNGGCNGEAHVCRAAALAWLRGPTCAQYLAALDLDPAELQPALVAHAERRASPAEIRPAVQLGLWAWAGGPRRPVGVRGTA